MRFLGIHLNFFPQKIERERETRQHNQTEPLQPIAIKFKAHIIYGKQDFINDQIILTFILVKIYIKLFMLYKK